MSDNTPDTPQTPLQADQRLNLRTPLITLKIRMDDSRKVFFGYTKNLSRSGMFVATLKELTPGQQLQVELPLPQPLPETTQCTCEVVWTRSFKKNSPFEPGVGLKFIDLDEAVADRIDAWIRST